MTATVTAPVEATTAPVAEPPAPLTLPKKKGLLDDMGAWFWCCVTWLGMVAFFAIFGPRLPGVLKESSIEAIVNNSGKEWNQTMSLKRPFGWDENGTDIMSAVILGARNSMIIAFATIVLAFLLGGTLGMIAGYRRGKIDTVLTFLTTALQSFPPLLFIIFILSVVTAETDPGEAQQGLATNVWILSFALAILSIPTLFRVVRAATIQYSQREFVTAARSMGAKTGRVLIREILPNVAKPLLAYGLVAAGTVMVIEGALSFLGVGIGEGYAWGKIIQSSSGITGIKNYPNVVFFPAFVLFMTVLSFNYIGDRVRARLEVKQAGI
jgi:peptide/nickel transport system permease protein